MTPISERCPKSGGRGGDRLEGPPSTSPMYAGAAGPSSETCRHPERPRLARDPRLSSAEPVAATQPRSTRGAVPDTVGNPRALFLEKEK